MTTAYLLLDLQRDFLERPGLLPEAEEVVRAAAALLRRARRQGELVVHVHTVVAEDGRDAMAHWRAADAVPCRRGTPGARPPPPLEAEPGEHTFEKQHYSAFSVPTLDAYLRELGVDALVLAGLYTHACIRATAVDAARRGYTVVLADEALGSTEPLHAALTRTWLEQRGVRTRSAEDIRAGRVDDDITERVTHSVRAARAPSTGLRRLAFDDRRAVLGRWAEGLRRNAPHLLDMMIEEIGKPRGAAEEEVERAIAHVETALDLFRTDEESLGPGCRVRHRPRGTLVVITPWNNPVAIPVGKLAPALLFGNGVIWKPSPRTPRCAELVLETLRDAAGVPDAVRMLPGDGRVARTLVAADGIDAVTFTGSSAAGRAIDALCRARGVPLQAELGGNNGLVLGTGVDMDRASRLVVEAAFSFAGQRCTAIRRLIVRRSDEDALLESLLGRVRTLEPLAPRDPRAAVGRVIDEEAAQRLAGIVDRAREAGARVLAGGSSPRATPGRGFPPTVLRAEDPTLDVVQEESFGPLLVVQPARDFEEQLALLDGVPQGLLAAILTADRDEEEAFLCRAQAGILRVNPTDLALDPRAPFGGRKASGLGPPEHGSFDRAFYAVPQAVYRSRGEGR